MKSISATVIATVFMVLAMGTPAAAAGTMCGHACNNEDPQTYWAYVGPGGQQALCANDATTVSTFVGLGRTVQLRYSAVCRTVWARIFGGRSQDKIVLERLEGFEDWQALLWWEMFNPSSRNWSEMYDDANVTIRACFQLTWSTQYPSRLGCTQGW